MIDTEFRTFRESQWCTTANPTMYAFIYVLVDMLELCPQAFIVKNIDSTVSCDQFDSPLF